MSGSLSGTVQAVVAERQGVIATEWSGTSLSVEDATDLDRSGGSLSPDDGATLYAYTGEVQVADDGTATVTMADQAPAGWPQPGGVDEDGQPVPSEVRLDIWPEAVDVVAQVDVGDSQIMPCVVPHALRPLLVEGPRGVDDREQVRLELVGLVWTVADVIGRRAAVGMAGLGGDVIQTIEAASASGVQRWDSINTPTVDGKNPGDIWFRHDGALTGTTIGQWHWDGAGWVADQIGDEVIANLDAGKVVGGTLSGLDGIFSPEPGMLPRTQIVGSTLQILRAGAEGEDVTTVQLGGDSDDQVTISDVDGSPLGGIDSQGNVLAQNLDVTGDLSIGGTSLADTLDAIPKGLVARQTLKTAAATNKMWFNNNELGGPEITFITEQDRIYKIVFNGMMHFNNPGIGYVRFRFVRQLGVTVPPDPPSLYSTQLASQVIDAPNARNYLAHVEAFITGDDNTMYRLGVSGQTNASSTVAYFLSDDSYPSELYVEDMGKYLSFSDGGVNDMGGTQWSGTGSVVPPTTTPVTGYAKSYARSADRTWRGSTVVSGNLMQGVYGGYQRYSIVTFGSNVQSDIGSGTVTGASVTIRNVDFPMNPGGSGVLKLGHFNGSSMPGSPQTGGGGSFEVPMTGGQTKTVQLPSSWWPSIKSGSYGGITLGESVSSDVKYYGHFAPQVVLNMSWRR